MKKIRMLSKDHVSPMVTKFFNAFNGFELIDFVLASLFCVDFDYIFFSECSAISNLTQFFLVKFVLT